MRSVFGLCKLQLRVVYVRCHDTLGYAKEYEWKQP